MYDLIGDIHGHATELKSLLKKMDYQEIDSVWQHSERKVIFLGDFVDRGPEQVETVTIARKMVKEGHALAVMGNHEFNAVAWATDDPENPGEYLRRHTDKNLNQHKEFLAQAGEEGCEFYHNVIEWFKTLPVYLDLPELRVVHACWHPEYIYAIDAYTDSENRLLPEAWEASSRKGSEAYNCIETLLKGWEIRLPKPHFFFDENGHKRTKIRTEWWQQGAVTYKSLAMVPGSQIERIPDDRVEANKLPGYDGKKPVFVGHYWLSGDPAPLTEHIACLDYSVAGRYGRKLCAYRFDGEKRLRNENFVWIEVVDSHTK